MSNTNLFVLFGEFDGFNVYLVPSEKGESFFTIQVGGNVELTGIAAAVGGNLSLSAPPTPPQLH